jgi:hypothetical protein
LEENGLILKMSMLYLFLLIPSLIFNVTYATTESYWSNGAPMPTARSEISSAVLDDKIYVIGGFEIGHSTTSIVEVYDPVTEKWSTVTPLPQPPAPPAAPPAPAPPLPAALLPLPAVPLAP